MTYVAELYTYENGSTMSAVYYTNENIDVIATDLVDSYDDWDYAHVSIIEEDYEGNAEWFVFRNEKKIIEIAA